jgi:hypothetical protein
MTLKHATLANAFRTVDEFTLPLHTVFGSHVPVLTADEIVQKFCWLQ